ncbi:MAG TPA: cytosine permease [Conexibacter sp.]|nr:cytosine permease [Conexibacter sp.]
MAEAPAIERRGIDFVPPEERSARPRDVFWIWISTFANVFTIISGALMVAVGLSFWQAAGLIVAGNAAVLLIGVLSLAGPRAGTSSLTIARAPFGYRGNRLPALLAWLSFLGFEASDLVVIVFAALVLLGKLGIAETALVKSLVIVVAIAIQLPLPVYGYQAILRAFRVLAIAFLAISLLMAVLLAPKVEPSAVHGTGGLVPWTLALALVLANGGLGWPNASDYTRYLPRATPRRAIVRAVGLGSYVPIAGLQLMGAALATVTPGASDVIHGLPQAFPDWFTVPYLLFAIVALYAVNTVDLYSSGLTLQAAGAPLSRIAATFVDMAICVPLVFVVVFSSDFGRVYNDFLVWLIVLSAPLCAVLIADYLLRGGVYDPVALLRVDGRARGAGWPALAALLLGMAVAALCVHTPDWVGPLAHALGGADVSALAGALVAGGGYALLGGRRARAESAATRAAGRDGVADAADELAIEHVTV